MMFSFWLSENQRWGVRSDGETRPWTEQFACLLGLDVSEDEPDYVIRVVSLGAGALEPSIPRAVHAGSFCGGPRVRVSSPFIAVRHDPEARESIIGLRTVDEPRLIADQMRYAMLPVHARTVHLGGLPLHAALIERDGRGMLLIGRSGVGKSTACSRLPPGWRALADDMALVVRKPGGDWGVHPLPTWSALRAGHRGRTWDFPRGVPLSAVFFLSQAAADERVPAGKAFATVLFADAATVLFETMRRFNRPWAKSDYQAKVFDNAAAMAKSVPTYILRLSLTGRFWEKIEAVLENGDSPLFRERGVSAHGT